MADGIIAVIWKDFLCRIAANPCPKPFNEGGLARAAVSPYRPKSTPPRLFGLQPGSTPEGIKTGTYGSEAYPDPQSPPVILGGEPGGPGGQGGGLPSPVKTEEIDQDEFRLIGTAVGAGFVTIFPPILQNDIDILEMNFCALAVTNLQLFRDGTPISGNYPLALNEKWSAPGLTLLRQQTIQVNISAAASVVFEVRWKWRTNAP